MMSTLDNDQNHNVYTTQDQINDLQKKIHLVEGDLKAYEEQSIENHSKNKSTIFALRKECRDLHKALAERLEVDSQVIDQAFDNAAKRISATRAANNVSSSMGGSATRVLSSKPNNDQQVTSPTKKLKNMRIKSAEMKERNALRNKSGEQANELIDQALCDQKKRLNAMKAETLKKRSVLKDLETTYDQLVKEASFSVEMSQGESKAAQKLTTLENRLDIAKRKSAEATHINKVYQLLHQYLEESSLGFHGQLDEMEVQIRKSKVELEDIRRMYEDSQKSRDQARAELQQTEERIACQRRVYEKQLNDLREQAAKVQRAARNQDFAKKGHGQIGGDASHDVNKSHDERHTVFGEHSARKTVHGHDGNFPGSNGSPGDEYDHSILVLEQTQKIEELEQHFQKIKEVTGVSELAQIVSRFEDQASTYSDLENKRKTNIEKIEVLNKQLENAKLALNEQKYGDAGSDSKAQKFRKDLEEATTQLQMKKKETCDAQIRADENKMLVDELTHALFNLTEKLERVRLDRVEEKSLALSQAQGGGLDPDNINDRVIDDLFNRCNNRVSKLLTTLPKDDELQQIIDTARTDDIYLSALENRMPSHNIRINNTRENTNITDVTAVKDTDNADGAKDGKSKKQGADGQKVGDDSDSGDDNGEYYSRDQIKRQANLLLDSKSKKRSRTRQGKRGRRW